MPDKPWERQPGESGKAFGRFCAYLEMGPQRSLPELSRRQGVSLSALKQLSTRWRWADRVSAWERELGRAQLQAASRESDEARQRQLRDAVTLQQLARAQISRWVERSEDGVASLIKNLPPAEVIQMWEMGFLSEQELRSEMRSRGAKRAQAEAEEPSPAPAGEEQTSGSESDTLPEPEDALRDLLVALRRGGMTRGNVYEVRDLLARLLHVPELRRFSQEATDAIEMVHAQDRS